MNIRSVKIEDAAQIAEIYNYYIKNTHHTFETEPLSAEEMGERIAEVTVNYPFLVAEDEGEIVGYAFADKFKYGEGYNYSVEVSIYVKNEAKKKGIGTRLYEDLFRTLRENNIHTIVAGIALPNDSSVRFHENRGFSKVAHFREIGYKLGRWIDVGYWQLFNRFDD